MHCTCANKAPAHVVSSRMHMPKKMQLLQSEGSKPSVLSIHLLGQNRRGVLQRKSVQHYESCQYCPANGDPWPDDSLIPSSTVKLVNLLKPVHGKTTKVQILGPATGSESPREDSCEAPCVVRMVIRRLPFSQIPKVFLAKICRKSAARPSKSRPAYGHRLPTISENYYRWRSQLKPSDQDKLHPQRSFEVSRDLSPARYNGPTPCLFLAALQACTMYHLRIVYLESILNAS